jgi:integrase/recombinase XerD
MPSADWCLLVTIGRNLARTTMPSYAKKSRLVHAKALFEFGLRLVLHAEESQDLAPLGRAVVFRDGFLIAFLAARPLRKRNVKGMRLGITLIKNDDRYWLRFGADATKTGRPIDCHCPDALTPTFDRYMCHHRQVLLGSRGRPMSSTDAVWISASGRPMNDMAIYRATTTRTLAEFGKAVNPHLFRDCVATTIAVDDPTSIQIAMRILGHTRLATLERHYILATGIVASRSLLALIEAQRSTIENAASQQQRRMPKFPDMRLGRRVHGPRRGA